MMSGKWMINLTLLLQTLMFCTNARGYQYYVCNMYADDLDKDPNDHDENHDHHGGHWWFGHWGNNHHVSNEDNTDGYVIVRPISMEGFMVPSQSTGTGT